jgi:sugar O-acyltransferase (sialic acid O-acetyltransferase NeuD family)
VTGSLAILGAGGHGRVVADSAAASGWEVTFFDDERTGIIDGWAIGGRASDIDLQLAHFDGIIVGIGNNTVRLEWSRRLLDSGGRLVSIQDPSSRVSRHAAVGVGTYIAPHAVVNIGSTLGVACIVNTAATVDHDCMLSDGVHLSPGVHLSGTVAIGMRSWLGTASAVRNNVRIGADVVSGVGSVIVKDIADGLVVVGVPANPLEKQ